ncbi:winged helix-turn-helix transcriptional regulator [Streptomyces benahoarensis]|uniref:Winged helix-turn-helix transcriptional regulator n=2 Tax=Streptomyces benahoarensis TaxID=2595054 RepID=A0A553ZK10_9ACTN|nr:winged helix-turn-helix domain-containing protein [Streptomyces benahoarensis]TSB26728.1 winged helix-turn-helix transcriptional regulator [Streptomyces benahoarensis]TSB41811.1 winged helix-turn-helix transcriptional regulator [Streptomyces benahoarensis]
MPGVSPRGTYLVIADALRKKIANGAFEEEGIPSEAALMRTHGVARTTVRRALEKLEQEGLIHSVPGVGRVPGAGAERRPLLGRITDFITAQGLAVGDPLPSEARLCEEFSVSRTALRSALSVLEGQGVLQAVHGKGRTIRALPPNTPDS